MTSPLQTITAFGAALRAGSITSEQATTRCLDRIAGLNPELNAYITVLGDAAMAQARQLDRELAGGHDRGPLHGVPISIKDIFDLEGVATTAASNVRRAHVARADAVTCARLRAAGTVFLGKTNLHEFALGTTNEDSAFGPARHPLDPTRSPGGSSGGSAASVLAGMAYASLGTDTGGSIRIPSAACGLVGLKPRIGELPTEGVVPLSTTLDHVGPIALTVADARVLYDCLRDQPSRPPSAVRPADLRLGIPRRYFLDVLDAGVASAFEAACDRLRTAGATLVDVDIRHADETAPVYLHIALPEAAAYHATMLDSRPEDYTPNTRVRLEMGRYILAEDYVRALSGRAALQRDVDAALDGVHALVLPSLAVPATPLGAATVRVGSREEPVRNITLRLTQLFNVTGHPAITLPCGTTPDGFPVGAQLAGSDTAALLDIAEALEPYLGPGRSR